MWVCGVAPKIFGFVQWDVEVPEDDDVAVLSFKDVGPEVDEELLIIVPGSAVNSEHSYMVNPTIYIKSKNIWANFISMRDVPSIHNFVEVLDSVITIISRRFFKVSFYVYNL